MGSTRFPGKPLAKIAGTAMLERVWKIARSVPEADDVVIATDSEEIKKFAESFGAQALLTSEECATGTDRVAQAAELLGGQHDIVFSFQGDAVLMPPSVLTSVIEEMRRNSDIGIATPAVALLGERKQEFVAEKRKGGTTGTSVVFDQARNALYFSKGLVPNPRDGDVEAMSLFLHIGLYGYRRDTLKRFTELPQSPLESIEKLEQLRALENGIGIRIVLVNTEGRSLHSVDSPDDVGQVEAIIKAEGELLSSES